MGGQNTLIMCKHIGGGSGREICVVHGRFKMRYKEKETTVAVKLIAVNFNHDSVCREFVTSESSHD